MMNVKKFKNELEETYSLLNLINFEEFLKNKKVDYTVSDLMQDVEKHVHYSNVFENKINNDFFQGEPFNYMTEEEFIEYLQKRYKNKINFSQITKTVINFS